MTSELYFQAAILGVMLAFLCIMGWRRIVPVILIGFVLGSPSAFASTVDEDNDVPSIQEVRDALLAQKTMLDNYFSGYTAPNKLNDISNALYSGSTGVSVAQRVANLEQTATNLLTSSDYVSSYTYAAKNYLSSIKNQTANLDSDDDVPTLQNIELNITDLDLHNQSSFASMITKLGEVKTALDDIASTPSLPTYTTPSSPTVTYAPDPVKTFAENAATLPTPPIESNVTGQESGFENAANDFTIGSVSNTSIPVLSGVTHSGLLGSPIATINTGMGSYATTIGNIIRPLLTAWLIFICLSYTTKTSIRILAA